MLNREGQGILLQLDLRLHTFLVIDDEVLDTIILEMLHQYLVVPLMLGK